MTDLAATLTPVAQAALGQGETLVGCCVATEQRTFSGRMVAIAVGLRTIVVQPLDRRLRPTGVATDLPLGRLAHVSVVNGVGGSVSVPSVIIDAVSVTVTLSPIDAPRLRLMLVGSGGQVQHDGIAALLAYLKPLVEGSA
jgi:hypothetical protein